MILRPDSVSEIPVKHGAVLRCANIGHRCQWCRHLTDMFVLRNLFPHGLWSTRANKIMNTIELPTPIYKIAIGRWGIPRERFSQTPPVRELHVPTKQVLFCIFGNHVSLFREAICREPHSYCWFRGTLLSWVVHCHTFKQIELIKGIFFLIRNRIGRSYNSRSQTRLPR